jgi:metal-sulfur cluster biosynthetic enzyme
MNTSEVAKLLQTVIDPELGVDIVSLGLVYGIVPFEGGVRVAMTTTTPLCPMGSAIIAGAEDALRFAFPASVVDVQVVHEPVWETGMIDEATRKLLRIR